MSKDIDLCIGHRMLLVLKNTLRHQLRAHRGSHTPAPLVAEVQVARIESCKRVRKHRQLAGRSRDHSNARRDNQRPAAGVRQLNDRRPGSRHQSRKGNKRADLVTSQTFRITFRDFHIQRPEAALHAHYPRRRRSGNPQYFSHENPRTGLGRAHLQGTDQLRTR